MKVLVTGANLSRRGYFRTCTSPTTSRATSRSRQLQIVELVGRGLRNREIASVCGMSPNTVRNQLVSIFGKLEVTTRGELIARAAASGLLTPFQ